jgi:hypothetical protein
MGASVSPEMTKRSVGLPTRPTAEEVSRSHPWKLAPGGRSYTGRRFSMRNNRSRHGVTAVAMPSNTPSVLASASARSEER